MPTAPLRTLDVSPAALERIAQRACALQGLPEPQYRLITPAEREHLERGVYNTLAALESLGWQLLPPDSEPRLWLPGSL